MIYTIDVIPHGASLELLMAHKQDICLCPYTPFVGMLYCYFSFKVNYSCEHCHIYTQSSPGKRAVFQTFMNISEHDEKLIVSFCLQPRIYVAAYQNIM